MSSESRCVACATNSLGFCAAVLGNAENADRSQSWRHYRIVAAGKQVFAPNQPSPDVYVLCSGWGFRFLQLPGGRRQILNFLLPGDPISTSSVFEERFHFSVEAVTTIQISGIRRAEVQSRLATDPTLVAALAKYCSAEAEASDRMMAALGQFSADERIAYLLLHLMKRIAARNVIRDRRYPLPLRQQHIADAAGLTSVHVSRVLGAFRDRGIANLSDGVLEVFDLGELERLGALP